MLILTGLISAYAGALVGSMMTHPKAQPAGWWSGIVTLLGMAIFIGLTVWRGLGASVGAFVIAVALVMGCVALVSEGTIVLGVALVQLIAVAVAIAGSILGGLAISIAWLIERKTLPLAITAIAVGTLPGVLQGVGLEQRFQSTPLITFIIAGLITLSLVGLSLYLGWRVVAGDRKYRLIYAVAIVISTMGGTRFRGANLTDADFTQATLPYTDFRKATLKRTSWFQASKLELSRVEGTYLEDSSLRHLVVSKDGHGNIYDYKNLQGLNLQAANLIDASFIGTDFNEATLQNADLTRAKLVKTRLYGADLTRSCLTGACIQDWAISTDTHLEQVTCTHIYMRLPTQEDPDPWRKPDNRNETFQEGDFTDFIAPIIKTLDLYRQQNVDPRQMASTFKSLDLYHYGGIDPAAAAIALQQLAEENPEARLEIVALEGRGEEKVRLQAAVTGEANSSQLNAKYFEKYRQISALPYRDIQTLLAGAAEKDERIRSLEKLLENALQQPKFYVETYQNQGEFIMSQSKGNVNISGVQGNVSGVAAAGENQTMTGVAIGDISGSVTNTINQLPASPDPDSPGIKELLAQLQAAIEAESELPDEDKAEALEQVKTLAEAGQKPEDNVLQKAAKTSMKILKGTVANLPDAAKLAESCVKLLPAIATLLAFV